MLVVRLRFSELHKIAARSECCNLSGQTGDVEKAFPDEWKGLHRAIIRLEQGGRESVFRISVTKRCASDVGSRNERRVLGWCWPRFGNDEWRNEGKFWRPEGKNRHHSPITEIHCACESSPERRLRGHKKARSQSGL